MWATGRGERSAMIPMAPRIGRRQFGFVLVLAYTMAIGTLMVPAVGVLAPFLRFDLGISRAQIGWLVTVFAIVATGTSPLAGRAADRLGGRIVVLGVFGLGSTAALVMAFAPSYRWLIGAAAVAGLANAAGNPGTNKLVTVSMAVGQRGTAMGIKQSGVQAAVFVCGMALPPIAGEWGWRLAMGVTGVLALAGLFAALRLVPSGVVDLGDDRVCLYASGGVPRMVGTLAACSLLVGTGSAAVSSFLPLYAQEQIGMAATSAGTTSAAMGLAGMVARVIWGRATEQVRSFFLPLAWIAGLSVAATVLTWLASAVPALVWVGSVMAGASSMSWMVVAMLAVVVRVVPSQAGRASAWLYVGFMGGYALGPVLIGSAVDATGRWAVGWLIVGGLFAAALLVSLVAYRYETRLGHEEKSGRLG